MRRSENPYRYAAKGCFLRIFGNLNFYDFSQSPGDLHRRDKFHALGQKKREHAGGEHGVQADRLAARSVDEVEPRRSDDVAERNAENHEQGECEFAVREKPFSDADHRHGEDES